MKFSILLIFALFPYASSAAVQISEIAWMGGVDSANYEWIELYNTGEQVSLDGWILHDANNLTIELFGEVGAGDRIVLERTSDTSAPGSAFLLYTGALSNAGETLVLRNADGAVVDQVNGGENWENIGGDNITKQTAQLSDGGWITATATPGRPPEEQALVSPEVAISPLRPQKKDGTAKPSQQLTLPDISLQLTMDVPDIIYAGQPFSASVQPSGVGKTIADSLKYQWSLGNGESSQGKEVTYTYTYPGQYVIVVSGEYKRQKQFARKTVSVLPVELELVRLGSGEYVLRNLGDTEVDLGEYRLVGTREYTFPKHMIILSKNEVVIPIDIVSSDQMMTALYDQLGQVVAMHVPGFTQTSDMQGVTTFVDRAVTVSTPRQAALAAPVGFDFVSDVASEENTAKLPSQIIPTALAAEESSTQPKTPLTDWPLYGLVVLLFLGTIGIYLVPQKRDDPPWV